MMGGDRESARRGAQWLIVFGLFFGLTTAATPLAAAAADFDLIGSGSSAFLNRYGIKADRAKVKFAGFGPLSAAADEPSCPASSSLQILTDKQQESFALDCSGWSGRGSAWKYKAPSRSSGAVRSITFNPVTGKLAIKAQGEDYGINAISGPTAWVQIQLSIGDTSYCGRFAQPLARRRDNNNEKVTWKGVSGGCSAQWPTPTSAPTPTATLPASELLPKVRLNSPLHGSFTTSGSIAVSGEILNPAPGMTLRVNGVQVNPVDNHFSTSLPTDASAIVNSVVAELETAGSVVRDRVDVIIGERLQQGQTFADGFQLRIGNSLLDRLEPLIAQKVQQSFDGIDFVPPGTGLHISGPPEVTFGLSSGVTTGGFSMDVAPTDGSIDTALVIPGFHFNLTATVRIPMPFPIPDITAGCSNLGLAVGRTVMSGRFRVQATTPLQVDEIGFDLQIGSLNTGGATCAGIPLDPLLFGFTPILTDLISDLLRNPASVNNGSVARALREALQPFAATPFTGGSLDGLLSRADELTAGMTMAWNSSLLAIPDLPFEAPRLAGCFLPNQSLPVLGSLTPNGQPFDAAIGLATSTFNQLLQASVENGGLFKVWQQVPIGTGNFPLTPALLDAIFPNLHLSEQIGAATSLALRLSPAHPFQTWADGKARGLAPLFTGNPGPDGTIAELLLPFLQLELINLNTGEVLFRGAFQGNVGVNFALTVDPDTGAASISVSVTDIDWTDVALLVLGGNSGLEQAALQFLLPIALQQIEPYIQDALGQLPIPQLAGYDLSQIEIDQLARFILLFVNVS